MTRPSDPVLDRVRGARPLRLADPPAAHRPPLAAAAVGQRVLVAREQPAAPAAGQAARAVLDAARAAPVQADQLERPGRDRADGSLRLELALLHEPGAERGAGKRGGEDGCDERASSSNGPASREADTFLARKENALLVGRIFTSVKRPFIRGVPGLSGRGSRRSAPWPPPRSRECSRSTTTLEVNPVTSSYLDHQLQRAQDDHYDAAVVVIDTPGGLSESMRKIVKKEIGLKIPVIVYVSPSGARAASAGVWITEAADVAAMAPATNIGSSTPIDSSGQNLGSDLRRKVINDAVASLTSLMKFHHRNAAWAADAVRKASNLDEQQAKQMNVVDVLAPTLPALLNKIDGRKTAGKHYVLHTANAQIDEVQPGLLHEPAEHADRPEPDPAALPRRHRGDRLRDLPPGRRAARRARRGLAAARAVRLLRSCRSAGPASRCCSSASRYS